MRTRMRFTRPAAAVRTSGSRSLPIPAPVLAVIAGLLFLLTLIAVPFPAAAQRGALAGLAGKGAPAGTFVPGEVLVTYRSGTSAVRATRLESRLGAVAARAVPGTDLRVVSLPPGTTVAAAVQRFNADPAVAHAQPNYTYHAALDPNDPLFPSQWNLRNTGQNGGTTDADIDAWEGWDIINESAFFAAHLDTGVDLTHQDLAANIWINQAEIPSAVRSNLADLDGDGLITFYDLNDPRNQGPGKVTDLNSNGRIDGRDLLQPTTQGGWANGVSDNSDSFVDDLVGWNFLTNNNDPSDTVGHGTHTAGIIGAVGNNGVGVAGVSWKAQILPLKIVDNVGNVMTANALAALQYATRMGAKISNNSWGGHNPFDSALFNGIDAARNAGHIFVAAAGNSSLNIDTTPFYPASFNLNNIISVAATDRNDQRFTGSNFGPNSVDLGAPGAEILSTIPGGSYAAVSGTSMAAPHVTGSVALLMQDERGLNYLQLRDRVLNTVDLLVPGTGQWATQGRLNLDRALRSLTSKPPVSISNVTLSEGQSGTRTFTFGVSLAGATSQPVIVSFATRDGTAKAPEDYVAASGTLVFTPGNTTATIPVVVFGDPLFEGNETFFVDLGLSGTAGTGTINNDDAPPTLSVANVSLLEGNSGDTSFVFTVNQSASSGLTTSFNVSTTDGSATSPEDFDSSNIAVTISPLQTSGSFSVQAHGDTKFEPDEMFVVNIGNVQNASPATFQAIGTIRNDDFQPTVTFNLTNLNVQEGNSGPPLTQANTTATPIPGQGTVTSPINVTGADGLRLLDVDVTMDITHQWDSELAATLISPSGDRVTLVDRRGGSSDNYTNTTFDDQAASLVTYANAPFSGSFRPEQPLGDLTGDLVNGTWRLEINDFTGADAGTLNSWSLRFETPATTPYSLDVNLSNATYLPASVDVSTANGTGLEGFDFQGGSVTLNYAPGETKKTFNGIILGDLTDEGIENFSVNLSNLLNVTPPATSSAIVIILDDDSPPAISIAGARLPEGNSGPTEFKFDVALSHPSDSDISVDYAVANGSAREGEDFGPASGKVTFPKGIVRRSITVQVNGDPDSEPDETFTVNVSNPQNAVLGVGTATGTIVNDDGGSLQAGAVRGAGLYFFPGGLAALVLNVTSNGSAATGLLTYSTRSGALLVATEITGVTFRGTADGQEAFVVGKGTFNRRPGFTFSVNLVDGGSPGAGRDRARVEVRRADGTVVHSTSGTVFIGDFMATPR